jgi:hypothetical protein
MNLVRAEAIGSMFFMGLPATCQVTGSPLSNTVISVYHQTEKKKIH